MESSTRSLIELRRNAVTRAQVAPPFQHPRRRVNAAQRVRKACCGSVPATYGLRKQTTLMLRESPLGTGWDTLQTTLSLFSCVHFITADYGVFYSASLDLAITVVFTFDFALRWYASPDRTTYLVADVYPAVDVLACAPVYLELALGSAAGLGFFRFVRVLRILRVLRLFRTLNASLSAFQRQLATLVLTVIAMVFITAGLMTILEGQVYEWQMGGPAPEGGPPRILTFGDAVYFFIVTLSTVGYGDLSPRTPLGKVCATLFIPLSIVLIPMQLNELVNTLSSRSKYAYKFQADPTTPHVLVMGHVTDEVTLRELLHELYHPDRLAVQSEQSNNRVTLVMGPDEPTPGLRALMVQPMLDGRLQYIRGDPKVEADLERAAASRAQAVFLLSDVATASRAAEDQATVFRTVLLRTHAPKLPTFVHSLSTEAVQCLDPDDEGVTTIAADELRARMLSRSAVLPGFSTLLCNLFRGRTVGAEHLADMVLWQQEYAEGTGVVPVAGPLPDVLDGLSFQDVARVVSEASGGDVMPIGVQEPAAVRGSAAATHRLRTLGARSKHGRMLAADLLKLNSVLTSESASAGSLVPGAVLLNPGRLYRCRAGQTLFCIARDQEAGSLTYDSGVYDDVRVPDPLLPHGRLVEDGYGFPDTYAAGVRESWTLRAVNNVDDAPATLQERRPSGALERNGAGRRGPPPAIALTVSGESDSSTELTGFSSASSSSFVVPAPPAAVPFADRQGLASVGGGGSKGGGALRSVMGEQVALHDMHKRQKELLRELDVHDVRSLPSPPQDHVVLVCRLESAVQIVQSLRSTLTHGDPVPGVVLLLSKAQEAELTSSSAGAAPATGKQRTTSETVAHLEHLHGDTGVHIVMGAAEDRDALARVSISTASCLLFISQPGKTTLVDGERVDNDVLFAYRSVIRTVQSMPTRPHFFAVVELMSCTDMGMLESGSTHGGDAVADALPHSTGSGGGSRGASAAVQDSGSALVSTYAAVTDRSRGLRSVLRAVQRALVPASGEHRTTAAHLRHTAETHLTWVFTSPYYAAGFAVPTDCLHTLLVSSMCTPLVMPLLSALLCPWTDGASGLRLEYVPSAFHGLTYGQLALELLDKHDAVLIGLYRCRKGAVMERRERRRSILGESGADAHISSAKGRLRARADANTALHSSPFAYVLTQPKFDTLLYSDVDDGDMAYILSRSPLRLLHGEEGGGSTGAQDE